MALTTFADKYTISHVVLFPDVVSMNQGDSIEIILAEHPVTGSMILDSLELTPITSPHSDVWKNATNLAYSATYDHITGTICNAGPIVNGNPTFVQRAFCMTLDGDPTLRIKRLHCYVGPGGSGDPDDGSWAGDVD